MKPVELNSKTDIKFTISNENNENTNVENTRYDNFNEITSFNYQKPRSQSENVLMSHMRYSGELNFLSLADLDKIRLKKQIKNDPVDTPDLVNKNKFKFASMSNDDLQNRTTYEVVDRFFSDGNIGIYKNTFKKNGLQKDENLIPEKKSQIDKLAISADHIDIYDYLYDINDEKDLKNHYSLPVIRTFDKAESNLKNKVSKNKSQANDSQPGTSYERSSIDDDVSFKSATDSITEDLEAIRHRIIGAHPVLTTLIIKQGLLLNNKFNKNTKEENLTNSWNMPSKNEFQPPPPYSDPMSPTGGNQHSRNQPHHQRNNDGLPPYSLHDERGYYSPGLGYEDDPMLVRKLRHSFIKKVYAILLVQLSITFTFILFCTYEEHVRKYVRNDWIGVICAAVITFALMIIIGCYEQVRKIWPVNFILLFGVVFSMTYVVSFSATITPKHLVLIAIGITLIACTLISVFAWQTKWDITGLGFMFFLLLLIFLIFFFIAILFYIFTGSKILHLILCGLGVLFVTGMLIFDTQRIVGGRRYDLSQEEYIAGALSLYFDIIMFFWFLLQVIRG